MSSTEKTTDASDSFVDNAPEWMRPHLRLMRVDRPVGVWLLFYPCIWGVLAAKPGDMGADRFWWLALLFLVGSFVMRSAGCVWNDLIDRDLDKSVERTRNRPIASGRVSPKAGLLLAIGLSLVGLVVLLQLGTVAIIVGLGSLVLVAGYPFMKRITWWPQLWLGLTFNWGVLVGGAAVAGAVGAEVLLIYAAGVFWTLGYDTIYALQDLEDDALAGIKSSARRLGGQVRTGVTIFYAGTLAFLAAAFWIAGHGFWLFLLVPIAVHFIWQIYRIDTEDPARNLSIFKSNVWVGVLAAAALLPF